MAAQRIGWLLLWLFGLSGCASVNLTAGFPEVSAAVEERSAKKIVWNRGTDLDQAAAAQLRSLLQRKLTADDAVQIAMLNNRDLQAMYTELGVAQADLVQAGLFKNPILDAAVFFPLTGVRPDFQLSVLVGVLDALYVPLRKRVATALFEEAKLKVTGAVLDFAAQVRTAFYVHQALAKVGEGEGYLVRLGDWHEMLSKSLTTFAERMDLPNNPSHSVVGGVVRVRRKLRCARVDA
jgi:cobalt-zinc-cadmium efflux system outer membrane protein